MVRLTRRGALAAGAAAAGGAVVGRHGGGAPPAAAAGNADAAILNLFLTLERVQAGFYRAALNSGRLDGELKTAATALAAQEDAHVALLERKLGHRAGAPPQTSFHTLSPQQFRDDAVALEEAAIAAYIGQAANLSRPLVAPIATLVSVEARQVAWLRDLAGVSPAPRAQDPSRPADAVLADLRKRGLLQ
jgi:ferritin-like protein